MTAEEIAALDHFVDTLKRLPSRDGLMSPYSSASGPYAGDSRDEIGEIADQIRVHNIRTYLENLLSAGTDTILCGEAPGFAGCRFSGIAFSDEIRIASQGAPFAGCRLLPGAETRKRDLMKERSASVVWGALGRAYKIPVLHNAVQLHPHEPGRALTNRTPKPAEVELGRESLDALIALVQPRLIVAVGQTAVKALALLGHEAAHVRHPARGGHHAFVAGLERLGVIAPMPQFAQGSLF